MAVSSPAPVYTENGSWGVGQLDYVFLSLGLATRERAAVVWHGDADEARGLGYACADLACRGAALPFRASNHNPVITILAPR